MSIINIRQGSLVLVDAAKVQSRGAIYVAQARIRQMMKWIWMILGIAIANPVLYLISVGIGTWWLREVQPGPQRTPTTWPG